MQREDWTIKSLWVGDSLSKIEQVSLASFVHHGHRTELFTYGPVAGLPDGVFVRDANEILPEDSIFTYKKRPSYAAFANWFRYVMLHREGGVWVDTDMVCLKPFDFETDMFFGFEELDRVNNAVLGARPGLELFAHLARQSENPNHLLPYDNGRERRRKFVRRYLRGNQRGDLKWGETGPTALTRAMIHFGLEDHALPIKAFYPIHHTCWIDIFNTSYSTPEPYFPETYAIHLWNEKMRRRPGFSKDGVYPAGSLIEELKRRYL